MLYYYKKKKKKENIKNFLHMHYWKNSAHAIMLQALLDTRVTYLFIIVRGTFDKIDFIF